MSRLTSAMHEPPIRGMAIRQQTKSHCADFLSENADRSVHRAEHRIEAPPLAELGDPGGVTVRRLTAALSMPGSSFDMWAALARLDLLLSDYRRIAPRFFFEQLTGEPSVAAGNAYRHTITDPARLARIEDACRELAGEDAGGRLGGARIMDVRVLRAGPWGGETGEMVMETLRNHALAGAASLFVLVHGEGSDGLLPVRLDICEIARWAWAPDRLAAAGGTQDGSAAGILDWPYFIERLAQALDAVPVPDAPDESFLAVIPPDGLAADRRLAEALRVHPALTAVVDRVSCRR